MGTAAGHGKNSADAVDGYIKEMCNRGGDFLNAQDICNLLQSKNDKTITSIIAENDIKDIKDLLPNDLKDVKGTMSIHHVVWLKSKPKKSVFS